MTGNGQDFSYVIFIKLRFSLGIRDLRIMISAILLAAGSSRRMGNDNKLLLTYQGSTILAITAEKILSAGISELIVVTGHEQEKVVASISHLPVRTIHNPRHEKGLTSSIQAGISLARGQGYMICLSDMVLITPEEYALLQQAFETRYAHDDRCIIQPACRGEKGNPVIFSSFYRDAILQHEEEEGCKGIVRGHSTHLYTVELPDDHILRDVDYPDDYRALPDASN
jgi:molybdenum cofactor cytidylyltransferase